MYQWNSKSGDYGNANSFYKNAVKNEDWPLLSCYGCGHSQQGFIKAKCLVPQIPK